MFLLQGLVQHDQIKEEILKQNELSFLLECTNKATETTLTLLSEILWSMTFLQDGARALRADTRFLEKIQTLSKDTNNEELKKAADGLTWKLVQGTPIT